MKKLIYLTSLLLSIAGYEANAQFILSAEVRPRTEFRNGFKTLTNSNKDAAFFTEQRSRLNADYLSEDFQLRVSFQDVRIWGESPQIFKEEFGKTFISEAWGQYFIKPEISVKAGRQIISYDNERILGGLEWAQQGRRHDALLFIYEGSENNTKLHLGFAYNQDNLIPEPVLLQADGARFYSVAGNYKTMQYGWLNKQIKKTALSLYALNTGYQNADSTVSNKQTVGLFGTSALGAIKLGGDLYYQGGKQGNKEVSALLAGINATFTTSVTPLTFGFEYISGDSDPLDAIVTSFSPDFGTNHAHNGFMDYFFVGPANGSVGVTDFYLKTNFKMLGGTLNVNVHEFLTGSTQRLGDGGAKLGKAMGTEVDLVYAKKLKEGVMWHIGYSQMFATDTMEALRGGDKSAIQNWAWTMITFKPTLFNSGSSN